MGPHQPHDDQDQSQWITSDRLVLRPLQPSDSTALTEGLGNFDVAKMTGTIPHPYTRFHAEVFIMMMRARRLCRGDYVWAICEPSKVEQLFGVIGLHPCKDGSWELGYWIAPTHWGKGYATHVGELALDFAYQHDLSPIVAGYYADNPASGRVLEKLGFIKTGEELMFGMARGEKMHGFRMRYVPDTLTAHSAPPTDTIEPA